MASEGDLLKLLGRPDLPADVLEEILKNRNARKYHTVRRALAGHPRTPRHAALSLVSTLYWRDLAGLSADARVHPEVRRAADRDIARRLPEMALSEEWTWPGRRDAGPFCPCVSIRTPGSCWPS